MSYTFPDLTGKRLLVLGAGRGQVSLIRAAKELGCTVIVATHALNYPGVELADEICLVDLRDSEKALHEAQSLSIDGVATSCNDIGLPAQGHINRALGLSGPTEMAAIACGDKYQMKEMLVSAGVSTAKFLQVHNHVELDEAVRALRMPLIIKATDLQGSRGIYICRELDSVHESFDKVMLETRRDYCIVEEFIEGEEFGAQAFVQDNEVLFVLPHGDETLVTNTAVPVGHYVPLENATDEVVCKTRHCVEQAIKAIGLDNCAVNVDMILRDGIPYIIELTGRAGANCLPEITSYAFGINYYKMIVLIALGMDAKAYFESRKEGKPAVAARMLVSQTAGTVKSIETPMTDDNVREITLFIKPGDSVRVFKNSNDCIGQVIVVSETLHNAFSCLDETTEKLVIEYE